MAVEREKTKRAEFRTHSLLHALDLIGRVMAGFFEAAGAAFKWGGVGVCAICAAAVAWSSKAPIVLNIVNSIQAFSIEDPWHLTAASCFVAVLAITWALTERWLRRRYIRTMAPRVKTFEQNVDSSRTSSSLAQDGTTAKGDR